GKVDDIVKLASNLRAAHTQNGAVQIDVVPAGELRVKAGADLEQRSEPAVKFRHAPRWFRDPRQDLEQRALACPVPSDDPDHLAGRDRERDVVEGPDELAGAARRNRPAGHPGPP